MGHRQPVGATLAVAPLAVAPSPRALMDALADGASALKLLAREHAYHAHRYDTGIRNPDTVRAHTRYTRLREHAALLTAHADDIALDAAREKYKELRPDEHD